LLHHEKEKNHLTISAKQGCYSFPPDVFKLVTIGINMKLTGLGWTILRLIMVWAQEEFITIHLPFGVAT